MLIGLAIFIVLSAICLYFLVNSKQKDLVSIWIMAISLAVQVALMVVCCCFPENEMRDNFVHIVHYFALIAVVVGILFGNTLVNGYILSLSVIALIWRSFRTEEQGNCPFEDLTKSQFLPKTPEADGDVFFSITATLALCKILFLHYSSNSK